MRGQYGEGDTSITLATRSFFRGTVVERQRRTRGAIELAVSESTARHQQPLQARLQEEQSVHEANIAVRVRHFSAWTSNPRSSTESAGLLGARKSSVISTM